MQQVPTTMPPLTGTHQPVPRGPFRTPVSADEPPCQKPPLPAQATKRAPSAAILTGESGANLVLSRLQGWGIPAQSAMPGVAYDLIADITGLGMLRLQVKTKREPTGQRWFFSMTRGFYYSKAGRFRYDANDYDIAAFVCLSISQVCFCAAPVHRVSLRTSWLRSPGIDRETFALARQAIQQRRHAGALSRLTAPPLDLPAAAPEALFPHALCAL